MPLLQPRRNLILALSAIAALVAPIATPAQADSAQADSVVEHGHSGLRLSDRTIRVLLARTSSPSSPLRDGFGSVTWNGRRYRGEIELVPDGGSVAVINRVDLEEYLRGVLPGELGSRDARDRAALQAQAVAARSYAAARMGERRRLYDVSAGVTDQVYGGMGVELPQTDDAVRDTRGLVLTWGDRIINAPYHAHGGPMTAAPDEVFWKGRGEPFLRPVDERSPDGGCYCDAGGVRTWERRFSADELGSLLARYGRDVGAAGLSGPVQQVRVAARGSSGRVTAMEVVTGSARAVVRGNDIRYLLRTNGALLPSTSFSLEFMGGSSPMLVVRGVGNGHGLGMSQWGAIGRARAGQDARMILSAYYPGTRVAPLL